LRKPGNYTKIDKRTGLDGPFEGQTTTTVCRYGKRRATGEKRDSRKSAEAFTARRPCQDAALIAPALVRPTERRIEAWQIGANWQQTLDSFLTSYPCRIARTMAEGGVGHRHGAAKASFPRLGLRVAAMALVMGPVVPWGEVTPRQLIHRQIESSRGEK
jgi:hypothetical protein